MKIVKTVKRIYLSGPMTGIAENNFPVFNTVAAQLRQRGLEVVNPAEIVPQGEKTWENCMRAVLKELLTCDTIGMLSGWERSAGAHLELHVAHRVGMNVVFVEAGIGEWNHG